MMMAPLHWANLTYLPNLPSLGTGPSLPANATRDGEVPSTDLPGLIYRYTVIHIYAALDL
jgi:hypothetical protein